MKTDNGIDMTETTNPDLDNLLMAILKYLKSSQDFTPGEYYGAFWSDKGYHGPLLDWHAGGSHHHRGTASAALALWRSSPQDGDGKLLAERAFDWLVARQNPRGGWSEIQNNETPSDWERTGLEELSTIPTAFVIHGLGQALLSGLPPKKTYMDCLANAGHWLLSIERPSGSGAFPHHERSPYDTLNANAHAVESLALIHRCLGDVYQRPVNIFLEGARRGFLHTLPLQWPNGCYPYRANNGSTINYTALVLWCFLNTCEITPSQILKTWLDSREIDETLRRSTDFLRACVCDDGRLKWDEHETSSAKHNLWTYAITHNVLKRVGGAANLRTAERLMKFILDHRGDSGLPSMRDEGEPVFHCLFMQADIYMFLHHHHAAC